MARPLWFVKILKKTFPNIKFIAKLTNLPIIGKIIDSLLFKGDDIIYLPQDKLVPIDKTVEQHNEYVLPSQVLEYFIEKANYHWIMDFCICRSSMHCKDYPIELGCLFLGEATLGINPQLGNRVSKKEAFKHLEKCRDAGLVHLIGRNRLDVQWLGVSPGEKLMTICHCCPCCCLWRVSPLLSPKIGSKVKKMPGVKVAINDKCVGCGLCTKGVCFVEAINLVGKRATININCKGCGRCVSVCPNGAIELTFNDKNYIKKSIKRMETLIDVR